MKYLVTDPCYIIPNKDWDKFVDDIYSGNKLDTSGVLPYKIEGVGKIIAMENTANGDGSTLVTDHLGELQIVGVDAGLVCIAIVSNTFKNKKIGALSNDKTEAEYWYLQALQI